MKGWISHNLLQPLALRLMGWKKQSARHYIFGRQWKDPIDGEVLAQGFAMMKAQRRLDESKK